MVLGTWDDDAELHEGGVRQQHCTLGKDETNEEGGNPGGDPEQVEGPGATGVASRTEAYWFDCRCGDRFWLPLREVRAVQESIAVPCR